MRPRGHGKIVEPLSAVRRVAKAGPPRMLRNGGRLCAGAHLRSKSIFYITFNMTKLFAINAKSIPSQISMVRYLETQTHTSTRTSKHAHTHTHTRTSAHSLTRTRMREALTYETMGAVPRWRREQWRSATKASSQRRPSTRCERKSKSKSEAPVDLAALRLFRVASRVGVPRWE